MSAFSSTVVFAVSLAMGLISLAAPQSQAAADQESPVPSATAPESTETPMIDAVADQRLRAMSDYLLSLQRFRFSVEITYDAVEPDGEKVQLSRRSRVDVMRPAGLRADSQGDRGWNQLSVYDGKYFLHHDRAKNVYSRVRTPDTLAAFFEFLFQEYGAAPPVADFILPDVHGSLTRGAESIALLGDAFVADKACEHIAFTGEDIDWQVWIEKGDNPWPRKFVITYKDIDVRPQFMAVFREWQPDAALRAADFVTTAPAGANEVALERPAAADTTTASDNSGAPTDAPDNGA